MQSTMIRQILGYSKKAFEDSFAAMMVIGQQSEKMANLFWQRSAFFPLDGSKIIEAWMCQCKNSVEDFRENVEQRFQLLEYCLLNAADQMESSPRAVGNKTAPVGQVFEGKKKSAAKGGRKEISAAKTVGKRKTTPKKK